MVVTLHAPRDSTVQMKVNIPNPKPPSPSQWGSPQRRAPHPGPLQAGWGARMGSAPPRAKPRVYLNLWPQPGHNRRGEQVAPNSLIQPRWWYYH
jgi:hypothetical protein